MHIQNIKKLERLKTTLELLQAQGPLSPALTLLLQYGVSDVQEILGFEPAELAPPFDGDGTLNAEEIVLCRQGLKINAIKAVRARTGLGLKEAKDLVENFCDKVGLTIQSPPF